MTKPDLLAAMRRERVALDELLAALDDAAMAAVTRDDGWTAKDVLAHLTAWEQRVLAWLDRWRATGRPERPEPGVTFAEGDALNVRDYEAAKGKPLADVRSEAGVSFAAVVRAVETLSEDELAVRPDAPDGPSWAWIVGANTHQHYDEHRQEIGRWLNEGSIRSGEAT